MALILLLDMPKCLSITEKMHPTSSESSPHVYLEIASTWLRQCIEGHTACEVNDPNFMPNRLIHVGKGDCDPFLVENEIEAAPYVALSYCWGNVENPMVTTRETLDEHRERIQFTLLSLV
jgi:hypothetical protein